MKARLPKGMGGGPANMQGMIRQAQKMQEEMARVQAELEEREFKSTSGGGAVEVTVTGKKLLKDISIKPEVVDPEDIDMLQDLIVAAVNEAMRIADDTSNEELNKVTGGLSIPGIM